MKSWILLISLAGLICGVWSQNAYVVKKVVQVSMNAPANISCNSNGVPLFNCFFARVGGSDKAVNVRPKQDVAGTQITSNYKYVGDGFTRGDCSIEIQRVGDDDGGEWKCNLVTLDGELRTGTLKLEILKKPGKPLYYPERIDGLSENKELEVTCAAANGFPKPTFKWFLGDKEITSGLSPILDTKKDDTVLTGQRLKMKVSWEDDGKELRCQTVHAANSKNDETEVRMKIPVTFKPRIHRLAPKIRADVGKEQVVSFNISGNPLPPVVTWRIRNITINSGYSSQNGEYTAKQLAALASNLVRADLVIKNVKEIDVDTQISLHATNQLGTETVTVKLSHNPDENGGLGTGGIVGLVIGIPVLIILIILIVYYTRSKGMLCFKGDDGTASEKERMGTDGDSNKGAAEENKPSLSARFHAFVDNLRSKKDKTAPADEEAAKEKDVVATEEKKTEEVVYTEPGFANNAEGNDKPVRRANEETPYAQIGSFMSPGQEEEKKSYADVVVSKEDEKPKSQAGSKNPSPKK